MIDNESWRISIEQSADYVEKRLGISTVAMIFHKYNASSLNDLNPVYYSEVFSEIYAIEVDLRN